MKYWLSSDSMTVEVTVSDYPNNLGQHLIVQAPPVVRKFIGQPIGNLTTWMARDGEIKIDISYEVNPESGADSGKEEY